MAGPSYSTVQPQVQKHLYLHGGLVADTRECMLSTLELMAAQYSISPCDE